MNKESLLLKWQQDLRELEKDPVKNEEDIELLESIIYDLEYEVMNDSNILY